MIGLVEVVPGLCDAVCAALMHSTADPLHALVAVFALVFTVLVLWVARRGITLLFGGLLYGLLWAAHGLLWAVMLLWLGITLTLRPLTRVPAAVRRAARPAPRHRSEAAS